MKYTVVSITLFFASIVAYVVTQMLSGHFLYGRGEMMLLPVPFILSVGSFIYAVLAKRDVKSTLFIRVLMMILNIPIILYLGLDLLMLFYFFDNAWYGQAL